VEGSAFGHEQSPLYEDIILLLSDHLAVPTVSLIVWSTDGIAGVLTLEGLGTLWTPGMMESDLQAFDRSQGLHCAMFHSCIL